MDDEHPRRALTATSLTHSQISGFNGILVGAPQTITVTAYDINGNRKYYGGDSFYLRIENTCTIKSDDVRCATASSHSNIPGLPIDVTMSDRNDGTYTYTVTLQGSGSATASVSVLTQGAVYTEYWQNFDMSGSPHFTYYESTI